MDIARNEQVEGLYIAHHGWLTGWLRRKLGDSFLAADLAQDTFVSVMQAGEVQAIREPRPFLATVAGRMVAHWHRRQRLESAYLEALSLLPEQCAPSPEAQWQAVQALQQLDQALAGLPDKVREAFVLAHLEGLSYADIAVRLQVSASSVKQYLMRANRQCLFALAL